MYISKNLFLIALLALMACRSEEKQCSVPEKIILDTDMGSDCDDVGALALLHHYASHGKADLLAVIYSSGAVPYGAGVVDAINSFYGRKEIPVGAYQGTDFGDPVDKMGAQMLVMDTATFKHKIIRNSDAREQTALNRQVLASQPDTSVTYITIGHTRGLYELLVSTSDSISDLSGRELIKKKLKRWVALGALGAGNENKDFVRDWNFFFNGTAPYTKYLVDHFPRPVYFVDGGSRIMTGRSLLETPPGNIFRRAYSDWLWNVEKKRLEDQRPSWDLVTVYFAVEGPGPYLSPMETGYLEFDPEKGCRWMETYTALQHFFFRQISGTDQAFSDYLNARILP